MQAGIGLWVCVFFFKFQCDLLVHVMFLHFCDVFVFIVVLSLLHYHFGIFSWKKNETICGQGQIREGGAQSSGLSVIFRSNSSSLHSMTVVAQTSATCWPHGWCVDSCCGLCLYVFYHEVLKLGSSCIGLMYTPDTETGVFCFFFGLLPSVGKLVKKIQLSKPQFGFNLLPLTGRKTSCLFLQPL